MAEAAKQTVHELTVHGVTFTVDTDLLDDVKTLALFDRIEDKGQVSAVEPLLRNTLGKQAYEKLEADFTKVDAEDHAKEFPDDKDYHPRMRIKHLQDTYLAIVEKFNPKA
jgi:hypothetical protein